MHKQFRDKDVIFIGLTDQQAADLHKIEAFLSDTGVTWLNGYSAGETLKKFGHAYYPQVWVIGRDGRIAWNENFGVSLEDGIEQALAVKVEETL